MIGVMPTNLPEASPGSLIRVAARPVTVSTHLLPLKLKILSIASESHGIEARCQITDAAGVSVEFVPIQVGPQRTPAELCAILQNHVNGLAASMHKRGAAVLPENPEGEKLGEAFSDLVGTEFTGSISL
jgi:hypothetical protein